MNEKRTRMNAKRLGALKPLLTFTRDFYGDFSLGILKQNAPWFVHNSFHLRSVC